MAATALQLYSLLYLTVKGKLLTETGSLRINRDTKASEVNTLAKGFAGVTPGPGTTSLQVTNAVPFADFELNPGQYMSTYTPAEIGVLGPGGKQLTVDCFILSDDLSAAAGSSTEQSFNLIGPFADWQ